MKRAQIIVVLCVCTAILGSSCARSAHQTGEDELQRLIPADVLSQVDDSISFTQLHADPNQYVGRTVMLSGVALQSRRTKDGTVIEILQVPTERGLSPSDRKTRSEGRFLAVQSAGFLDPAVIEKDSPLTVVGEVKGATTKALDEGEYQYPVLDVKHMIDWNDVRDRDRDGDDGGYYGRYGGYYPWTSWYYGYGSPFGPYGGLYPYSYYGPYYGFPRGFSTPAPPPPPPQSTPRLFQKD
ncbi:MAG TPA: Slp family lipoprotein [Nitrospira sp.]|nr:Slp family lipoprotein [Nitrospira sp.]